jgi:hypothetical protein
LASGILAIVMVAGYLGMMPLLQSLAAEPAWPDSPKVSSTPVSTSYTMAAVAQQQVVDNTEPIRQVVHHRRSHRNSTPATVHPSLPVTTAKANPGKAPTFSPPGNLSANDAQPTDNGASQSSGG